MLSKNKNKKNKKYKIQKIGYNLQAYMPINFQACHRSEFVAS